MNKAQKIKTYYNQKEKLSLKNSHYREQVEKFVSFISDQDLGQNGDVSTNALIKKSHLTTSVIVAKEKGIIAGVEETVWLLKNHKLGVISYKKDGSTIKPKDKIITLKGDIRDILKVERLAVNILQRMSGIATTTKKLTRNNRVLIVSTRKTLWGLMDKKAVTVGGGGTHRLGLYDWVLIKDNHIDFCNNSIESSTANLKTFWEIEAKNKKEVMRFAKLNPGAIMFDNFKPEQIKKLIKILHKTHPDIIFEASGMINEHNIKQYANSGVDVISLGALTHSAKALDISLDIL